MERSTAREITRYKWLSIMTLLCTELLAFCCCPAQAYRVEGVKNTEGKVILDCAYHRIELLPGNLILAEDLNLLVPESRSYRCKIFTASGIEITPTLPPDCTISDIHLSSAAVPKSAIETELVSLPKSTILEIAGPDGFGLTTPDGMIILEPKYDLIGKPIDSLIPVFKVDASGRHIEFILDVNDKKHRVKAPTDDVKKRFAESQVSLENAKSENGISSESKLNEPATQEGIVKQQKNPALLVLTSKEIPRYENIQLNAGDYWTCGLAPKTLKQNQSNQKPTLPQTQRPRATRTARAARQSHFASQGWHRYTQPWRGN